MLDWRELAGLGSAFVWSFSSIFFTVAGRRVGSVAVNRVRLLIAVLMVFGTHWLLYGRPFPVDAEPFRFGWLGLSAVLGLAMGDSMLFEAFVLVGPRIAMLLLSLTPAFGALIAWAFLGETLSPLELGAMALALGGVAWVVIERGGTVAGAKSTREHALGVLFGVGAALCNSAGLVASKRGLEGEYPALSGLIIRLCVALVVVWLAAVVRREVRQTFRKMGSDRQAVAAIVAGAITGPFVGVWLALTAVQAQRIGIASTLMAMTPVLSLPLVRWAFHERVSMRAVLGTFVAMAGVILML